jgi:sulfatase maturation enzyme AslB (radical SAM superfamily)
LHIFVVSLRCDHSCPYCQVSRQSEDKAAFDMTKEIADKALEFVFRSPSPAVKIEFQGGEPLLNFEIIKYVVTKAEEINQKQNRDLEFVIATTLSLITDEILEFCKEHSIILSSSLDGPEDLHNANRPRPGKNSHQKFIEGLNEMICNIYDTNYENNNENIAKALNKVNDIFEGVKLSRIQEGVDRNEIREKGKEIIQKLFGTIYSKIPSDVLFNLPESNNVVKTLKYL